MLIVHYLLCIATIAETPKAKGVIILLSNALFYF
jgi:hypothetical protein